MPNKPTTVPELDTNSTNRTIPAPSKVTDGYVLNDIFPADNANYLHGWAGDWFNWLDDMWSNGASANDMRFTGGSATAKLEIGEADFYLHLDGSGDPLIAFEGSGTYMKYDQAANRWLWAIGGVSYYFLDASNFRPNTTDTVALGTSSLRWSNFYGMSFDFERSFTSTVANETLGVSDMVCTMTGAATTKSNALFRTTTNITGTQSGFVRNLRAYCDHDAGTMTHWLGVTSEGQMDGGVVTNWYAYYVGAPIMNAGTITNMYGLYIPDLTVGGINRAIQTGLGDCFFGDRVYIEDTNYYYELSGGVNPAMVTDTSGGIDYFVYDRSGDIWKYVINSVVEFRVEDTGAGVGKGLHVGNAAGAKYDNDAIIDGGLAVGFTTDPGNSQVLIGDANYLIDGSGGAGGSMIIQFDYSGGLYDRLYYDRTNDLYVFDIDTVGAMTVEAAGVNIRQGLYVGNTGATLYDNDIVCEGGLAVGFAGDPGNQTVAVGDGDFQMYFDGTDPFIVFDSTDFFWFDRSATTSGVLHMQIAGADVFTGSINGVGIGKGLYVGNAGVNPYDNDIVCEGGLAVGFNGNPGDDQVMVGDNQFYLYFNGTDSFLYFDTNDRIQYDRSENDYLFQIDSTSEMVLDPNGLAINNGLYVGNADGTPTDNDVFVEADVFCSTIECYGTDTDPGSQAGLVQRNARNAIVACGKIDLDGSNPPNLSVKSKHFNIASVARLSEGLYNITLDDAVSTDSAVIATFNDSDFSNCTIIAQLTSTTIVHVSIWDNSAADFFDDTRAGYRDGTFSISVIGAPNSDTSHP